MLQKEEGRLRGVAMTNGERPWISNFYWDFVTRFEDALKELDSDDALAAQWGVLNVEEKNGIQTMLDALNIGVRSNEYSLLFYALEL